MATKNKLTSCQQHKGEPYDQTVANNIGLRDHDLSHGLTHVNKLVHLVLSSSAFEFLVYDCVYDTSASA